MILLVGFLLGFREGLEAALITGAVFGALDKTGQRQWRRYVWSGLAAALMISVAAGWGLHRLGITLEGKAEQIFEGVTMILAAGILTWMIFWMQKQSGNLQEGLVKNVHRAADTNNGWGIFSLVFFAVFREGLELALFLTAAGLNAGTKLSLIGGLVGLAAAAALGWALFKSLIQLRLSTFFRVTGVLFILIAAGLLAYGIHEFNELGWIPGIISPVWDINQILPEQSVLGSLLKAILGYNGNPSLTEVGSYIIYMVVMFYFSQQHRRDVVSAAG
jgi:high-affinity iron transporter